ncbi:hypothetical protein [Actinokineospora terrae]|uniref:Uncharacterized protein n=1 Tax=Actinokineospora terrae TaxID=155974 RepID=A0A1H9MQE0_9PSEU|nr:hypothetical protein [Actinokineospora terrae]SER25930.1 hypothetical protein SAMN04487818_102281 [Actinokineospora terrae]
MSEITSRQAGTAPGEPARSTDSAARTTTGNSESKNGRTAKAPEVAQNRTDSPGTPAKPEKASAEHPLRPAPAAGERSSPQGKTKHGIPDVVVRLSGDTGADSPPGSRGYPQSSARFEAYKADKRREMSPPLVQDPNLAETVSGLYRHGARIGSGSSAAAVRHERQTGEKVGEKLHSIKAQNEIRSIEKWLRNNPTASASDRAAAVNVVLDMKNALRDV